jgi:hypothetical protein
VLAHAPQCGRATTEPATDMQVVMTRVLLRHKHLSSSTPTPSSQRCRLCVSIDIAAASVTLSSSVFLQRPSHKKVSKPLAGSVTAQQLPSFFSERFHKNQQSVRAQQLCPASPIMCVTPAAQPQKVSQLLAGKTSACHTDYRLFQGYRTFGPACPKWHEGFTVVPIIYFASFARPASLYCQQYVYIYCIYTYLTAYRDSK